MLTGTNLALTGDNTGAGIESGEPAMRGYLSCSVWYEWTAPTNGILYFSCQGQVLGFLPHLAVYRGSAVNALATVNLTPDGGVLVAQGDAVDLQVSVPAGAAGAPGDPFLLTLSETVFGPASDNDAFANRATITTPGYHFTGVNYGAASEPGEPLPAVNDINTLWWDFVAPSDGVLSLTVSAPVFKPVLTVYAGASFGAMTPVIAQGSIYPLASVNYFVQGGQDYSVQLAASGTNSGQIALDAQFNGQSLTPTNDMFSSSAPVTGTNISYYGNFTSATSEAGEPASPATNTVWISWTAPCTGRANYIRPHSDQLQYVSVYTGATLALLQPVTVFDSANDISSFLAVQGTVYHFQFSGGGTILPSRCGPARWGRR
jgi:hypothetical protein